MKLILLHIFTGFTIGSKVFFDGKILSVVDFKISTPFSNGIIRPSWKTPIHFTLICKNKYGGIEIIGSKVAKSIYESGLSYNEICNSIF